MNDVLVTMEHLQEKYKGRYLDGYCQDVSFKPFRVVLFSEESIQLFRKTAKEGRVTLFMDATSNISKAIEGFSKKKIFYYALVVKSKSGKPVAVCEFFSSRQNYLSIMYCLECFFTE